MKFTSLAVRISLILLTASLFVAVAGIWAESIRPIETAVNTRRSPDPQLRSWSTFVRQCGIVVLIAVVGRKVLRIRL